MKITKILTALLLTTAILTSCKKDDAPAPPTPAVTVDANGNITPPSDAAGAMYAIYNKTFDDNSGSSFDGSQFTFAWFGTYPAIKDAGIVSANTFELDNLMNQYWSFNPALQMFDPATGSVAWSVQGNTASGITGFTHTDNTGFATTASFTLPASVNINTSYTLTHNAAVNADAVVYSIMGNKGQLNKGAAGNSTTVTFTAAELNQVAFTNDEIGFAVMPVKFTSATYNGKKYYFVKQYSQQRATATL